MYYWLRKLRTNEKPQNPSLSVFPQWLPVEIDEKPIDLETPLLIRVNHVVVEVRSGCSGQPLVVDVEILDPFLHKDALLDKESVLDVKARTESGMLVDVEVQLWNRKDIEKRTLYYWAKLFEGQLSEGHSYWELHKAVTINVVDFDCIPTDQYHSTFHLREDRTGISFSDLEEIHFVELRKLKEQSVGLERRLVRWMLFFIAKSREQLEELAEMDPAIKKAKTTLEFLSQDEEARRLYEQRLKWKMTYDAEIHGAREEGREEGERHARQEVAKRLLRMGLTIEQVAEGTGLSREEIAAILKINEH